MKTQQILFVFANDQPALSAQAINSVLELDRFGNAADVGGSLEREGTDSSTGLCG